MKLSELKEMLSAMEVLNFVLPGGEVVPSHFHVTEIGGIEKIFIDCGGTVRTEYKVSLQLWSAEDIDHRLQPAKLKHIISLSEEKLDLKDGDIEVEYQGETIGKYGLSFVNGVFHLIPTATACLATDSCGVNAAKPKIRLSNLTQANCCTPDSGCC